MRKLKVKNARKFELLNSDQTLEDMLRGNSAFETDIPVKKIKFLVRFLGPFLKQ